MSKEKIYFLFNERTFMILAFVSLVIFINSRKFMVKCKWKALQIHQLKFAFLSKVSGLIKITILPTAKIINVYSLEREFYGEQIFYPKIFSWMWYFLSNFYVLTENKHRLHVLGRPTNLYRCRVACYVAWSHFTARCFRRLWWFRANWEEQKL